MGIRMDFTPPRVILENEFLQKYVIARRMKENLPLFPQQYIFPAETIGEEQQEELEKLLS